VRGEVTPVSKLAEVDLSNVDYVLRTTRSVRKRMDLGRPVPLGIIEECLELAVQAPTAGNAQTWRFVVVADAAQRLRLAEIYQRGLAQIRPRYMDSNTGLEAVGISPARTYEKGDPRNAQHARTSDSIRYLVEHLAEVPLLILCCMEGRVSGEDNFVTASFFGGVLPAAWSLMLALRSRGLVSAWTTLHLIEEADAAAALGIPSDITQAVLLPVAYPTDPSFRPATRLSARAVTYLDHWGQPLTTG
jgi:nitroreductase